MGSENEGGSDDRIIWEDVTELDTGSENEEDSDDSDN